MSPDASRGESAGNLLRPHTPAVLSHAFDLSAVGVHAQWDSFALWAVVFTGGLALAAHMVVLTVRSKPPA